MKRALLIVLTLCLTFGAVACGGPDAAITLTVNGEIMMTVNTDEAGSLQLSAPNSVRATECVGWRAQKNGATIFLPVGATYQYEQGETTVFEPVFLAAKLYSEMGMSYAPEAHGITMKAELNVAEWEALQALSPTATYGILTALKGQLSLTGGVLTHAALAEQSLTGKELTAPFVKNDNGTGTLEVLLSDIPAENYWQQYTAVGYAKIAYTDGTSAYYYFSYGEGGAPAASIRTLASAAISAMTAEQQDALTPEEKEVFKAYISSVRVMVEKDSTADGKIRFDSTRYDVKAICDNEPTNSENEALWIKIMNLLPINHERALYVTLKDGTPLTEYSVAAVTYMDGTPIEAKRYYPNGEVMIRFTVAFHEGALVIGYTKFSPSV